MLQVLGHIVRCVLLKEIQYSHSPIIYHIFTNDSLFLMSVPLPSSKKY